MAKSVVKNIAGDVNCLEQIGLIEKKETARKRAPVVTYDRVKLNMEITV